MAPSTEPTSGARPLVVTDHPELVDDLLRIAAAACVDVELAPDPAAARASWATAPAVLVGADVARACARARLPRRLGVVLVAGSDTASDDDEIWRLAADLAADNVVFLPAAEPWLLERLTAPPPGTHGRGALVGVVGGRGGAGASVLAAALAVTSVREGYRTLLVDADPYGGGLDLVLGGEEAAGVRWPELAGTTGRVNGSALHDALPRVGELCVLSWDRGEVLDIPPDAVEAIVEAGRCGGDLVVVDLPRRVDEAVVRVVQAADLVLVVVPAEVRACAAAARVARALAPHCSDLKVVVRGPSPARLRSDDVAQSVGLPLAGVMRAEPGLAASLERGEAPGSRVTGSPLTTLCRKVLASLALPRGSAAA